LGNFAFNEFKRHTGPGDLRGTHLWHNLMYVSRRACGSTRCSLKPAIRETADANPIKSKALHDLDVGPSTF